MNEMKTLVSLASDRENRWSPDHRSCVFPDDKIQPVANSLKAIGKPGPLYLNWWTSQNISIGE
jgi:hypothetical protein